MSSCKSCFFRMEHAREAEMSRQVAELERELESTRRESQDRAMELLVAERAIAAERGLEAAETEVALQSTLETLEMEWKARSEVDQEVLTLRGRVLGTEELNAQLHEQVTRQEEGLSILENTHLDLGRKVGSLEQDLETARATIGQNAEALAKSLEERCALEGDLD
ncbi:uncharacterized protein [Miscanthus floridulus]|uniref:uncharacterized protein n=1 Tax=Miscanthus floridulus TaxID=154761 RepID=UPI00345AD4F0